MATKHHTTSYWVPCHSGWEENEKSESEKFCELRWIQLNRESKSCTCKQSKTRSSFTTSHLQVSVQPCAGKQDSTTHQGHLGRQTPALGTSPALSFAQLHVQLHVHPASPCWLLAGRGRKGPHSVRMNLELSTVFPEQIQNTATLATGEKINSSPAKTSMNIFQEYRACFLFSYHFCNATLYSFIFYVTSENDTSVLFVKLFVTVQRLILLPLLNLYWIASWLLENNCQLPSLWLNSLCNHR